ncbi:putative signal peptide and transmembrane protein [Rhodopirellula islandica]|uniref:Signal peptide and transmembrane protein n=1 Tax=Rhodopirellula islandica TaxID=595434 RepID=A0A0J1BCU6_RHOIS|nr:hypothetical protein [Rhodopirellula islandica]KLU04341.1 putative signal peptide and transmembrane protein [Rhodopirellula islandica]
MRSLSGSVLALLAAVSLGTSLASSPARIVAEEWSPVVVPTGEYRAQIQATPIAERPGRLFHVYGNTVRWVESAEQTPLTYRPLRRVVIGTDGVQSGRGTSRPFGRR